MCTICLVNKKESTLCRLFCLLNKKLPFSFGIDGDGNYGYYGADDSLIPFKKDDPLLPSSCACTFDFVSNKTEFTNSIAVQASSDASRKTIANISGMEFTKISGNFDQHYHHVTFIKEDGTSESATFGRSIDIPDKTMYVIYAFKNSGDLNNYRITFS